MGVTMFDFLSDKLGYHTKLYVILPGCVNQGKKPAGTLYLLHGGGGNSQDWIRFSSIERYAEEKNFAVVMPEVDGGCFYSDMKYGYPYFPLPLQSPYLSWKYLLLPTDECRSHLRPR